MLTSTSQKLFKEVLSLPTAPFHEQKVMAYIAGFCVRNSFAMKQDAFGNILIKYKRGKASQGVSFVAHMDHPGFEILSVKGQTAEIGIMGATDLDQFINAKVIISTRDGMVKGRVEDRTKKLWHKKPVFKIKVSGEVLRGDFGYYDLKGFELKGKRIFTKSADNLTSVAILLNLLLKLHRTRKSCNVEFVFTRGEEVGFIGCLSAIHAKKIRRSAPVIVLETSSAIAGGVLINGGPVIRVGDKRSTFSPEADAWLQKIALLIAKKDKKFKFQRALLPGGTCEASAFSANGYIAGCIAFPLGNYHNTGPKGYAEEYIGTEDYVNGLKFLTGIVDAVNFKGTAGSLKKDLIKNFKKWKGMLG